MRGLVLLAFVLSLPGPAQGEARRPVKDGTHVDLGGGWRWLPEGSGPTAHGRFAWQPGPDWSLGLELGAASIPVGGSEARLLVVDIGLALQWHPTVLGPFLPYLTGGTAYHVVGITEGSAYREGATAGVFFGAGVWAPLGSFFGLFAEGRYGLANLGAELGSTQRVISVGGVMTWGGITVMFGPEPAIGQEGSHGR